MDWDEVVKHTERLIQKYETFAVAQELDRGHVLTTTGARAEVEEFLCRFAGSHSAFCRRIAELNHVTYRDLVSVLQVFCDYTKEGLSQAVSPEVAAKREVVTDLLTLATSMLDDPRTHPGAAVLVAGATLEEFLREWVCRLNLSLDGQKPSLSAYCGALRRSQRIEAQDAKDLESWVGLRNHAAHGEWEKVKDRDHAELMLKGVGLFLRTHGDG